MVGVFDDRATAEAIVAHKPCYYRLFPCRLNELNAEALAWIASSGERDALEAIAAACRG